MRTKLLLALITGAVIGVLYLAVDYYWKTRQPATEGPTAYSNIHPADYVGPETCAKCHTEQYETWKSHPHSKMNLNATDETVLGDFAETEIKYGDGRIVFHKQGDDFLMSLYKEDTLSRQYRVTRTVGSRFTQMYIGLQTVGPEPEDHQVYRIEGKLPFGYWLNRKLWTPVSYFDSAFEPEPESGREQTEALSHSQRDIKWELNCLYCHNTYAYQHRVHFGHGTGFQREDFRFPEGEGSVATWGALTPEQLVTLGISCESCHFGGREHAVEGREIRFYPTSPQLTLDRLPEPSQGGSRSARVINSICSQCHCAQVTLYPNGAATWNSREALDLESGACQNRIRCTDCHNPHAAGPAGGLAAEPQVVATCVRCHQSLQDDAVRAKHTRHAEGSVTCLDCHMPRIVQGLDTVVRTHYIGSPTDERMLRSGAPNACNLCHLDRSIEWTFDELNRGWEAGLSFGGSWASEYGANLEVPVGQAWLNHSQPLVRLVASDAFARTSRGLDEAPELLELLNDRYAVNRVFGLFAVERLLGRELREDEYSLLAPPAERRRMVESLQGRLVKPVVE
jgi:predicted CXXCH cytochrome family protein